MPSTEGPSRRQEPTRRLFFALWPGEPEQREMECATREAVRAAPRAVPARNFHVTLVFLGSVPEIRVASVRAVAQRVSRVICDESHPDEGMTAKRSRALELVFERVEYWKKARVLCALTGEVAASVSQGFSSALADRLRDRLLAEGFDPDLKPFRAHVTLARKVAPTHTHVHHPSPASLHAGTDARRDTMPPVIWRFTHFALIDSRTDPNGSVYSVLDRWPLCTESPQISGKKAQ